jgi:anti-sigma regulatory factor (Ser/Thr protein kinase)
MNSESGLGFHQAVLARGQTLKIRIPPNARFGRDVRRQVLAFARQFGVSLQELEEFIFAIGEALANAIEHSQSNGLIEVRCQVEDDKIMATILDSGAGFKSDPVRSGKLPDVMFERGRGLPIMRRCTDIFALHSVPGRGTAVVLGRYFRSKSKLNETDQETGIAS